METTQVVVVGGGFAGVACARLLADEERTRVTLVDRNPYHQFQPLLYQVATAELAPADMSFDLAGIFVQIGLLPNTEWLAGVVDLSARGEIVVDDRGETSVPGVFAAGDCTTVPYKQIVIAMGAGSTAGLSAFDHLIRTSAPEPALV